MKRLTLLMIAVALGLGLAGPAQAQAEPPVVHAVLFFSPTCPHCHLVMEDVLPPLRAQYGAQLVILEIDATQEAGGQLYYAAIEALGIPPERLGVPTLIVGDTVLVGSAEIPEQLPGLIEQHLSTGLPWPAIPGLEAVVPTPPAAASAGPVVRAALFWSSDCAACQAVVADTLPALAATYGSQLDIQLVDVITAAEVDRLYEVATAYGLAKEAVQLPLLIIGSDVLVGSDVISAQLPGLIERHLAAGGVAAPNLTDLEALPGPSATPPAANGFALAVAILVAMAAALVYAARAVVLALRGAPLPAWPGWLNGAIPVLAMLGLGVAAYLAYVETQAVPAVCGPIGDCNAVQSSPYARLFGWLPIGVLGVGGYVAILLAWAWGRLGSTGPAVYAPLAVLALTVGGVLFSLYLTYLEPFVIGAVCAWCLASAVIMTLLALLSLRPALPVLARLRRVA